MPSCARRRRRSGRTSIALVGIDVHETLASNALWFGFSTLVSSFENGSWCRLFSVALNHKSVLVPPSPNPGLAPVLLKTVPSLSSLVQLAGCRAAIRSWYPIFHRRGSFACQLHADGVVLPADSVSNFQDALDAVSGWGRKCRFTLGISPTKSKIMIFGPGSHIPSCAVTLAGTLSLVVDAVVLTHFSLGSVMYGISFHVESHIRPACRLVLLGSSPKAIRSLSILCASQLSGRFELCLNSTLAVPLMDGALRKLGRHLLGWPSGSPSAAFFFFFFKLDWPYAQHLCAERLLSLSLSWARFRHAPR